MPRVGEGPRRSRRLSRAAIVAGESGPVRHAVEGARHGTRTAMARRRTGSPSSRRRTSASGPGVVPGRRRQPRSESDSPCRRRGASIPGQHPAGGDRWRVESRSPGRRRRVSGPGVNRQRKCPTFKHRKCPAPERGGPGGRRMDRVEFPPRPGEANGVGLSGDTRICAVGRHPLLRTRQVGRAAEGPGVRECSGWPDSARPGLGGPSEGTARRAGAGWRGGPPEGVRGCFEAG